MCLSLAVVMVIAAVVVAGSHSQMQQSLRRVIVQHDQELPVLASRKLVRVPVRRVEVRENLTTPAPLTVDERYLQHLAAVLEGCGEICDLGMQGTPSLFFDYVSKAFDCMAIGANPAIDEAGFETPPPREMPQGMREAFTYGGRVPVGYSYYDAKYLDGNADTPVWTAEMIDGMVQQASRRELDGNYGRDETNWVIEGLSRMDLKGADVLVIGSENPWVEACVLQAGAAHVTTLEYGRIVSTHSQVSAMTPGEMRRRFRELMGTYDAVVTFSSVEHSGLGRYGDALNPYGDKQAMARAWCLAKPGARLLVGVMSGGDHIEFNAHRIYGPLQYQHLLANWEQVWRASGGSQTVHVLRKPSRWVGVRFNGQLGNQMFEAASSFGIAKARGARWCIQGLRGSLLDNAVQFTRPVEECPSGIQFAEEMEGRYNQRFVPSLMDGKGKGDTIVGTYLQTWTYFADSGIPFALKEKEWGERWVQEHGVDVAIHVRSPEYGLRASEAFFVKAIELLERLTKGREHRFVVTTDDHAWVRSRPVFRDMVISEGNSPAQDMSINAACKHMIMSVGTFGWWGAYLKRTNGTVIYWIVPFNVNVENHDSAQFYLPEWIPVAADKE